MAMEVERHEAKDGGDLDGPEEVPNDVFDSIPVHDDVKGSAATSLGSSIAVSSRQATLPSMRALDLLVLVVWTYEKEDDMTAEDEPTCVHHWLIGSNPGQEEAGQV